MTCVPISSSNHCWRRVCHPRWVTATVRSSLRVSTSHTSQSGKSGFSQRSLSTLRMMDSSQKWDDSSPYSFHACSTSCLSCSCCTWFMSLCPFLVFVTIIVLSGQVACGVSVFQSTRLVYFQGGDSSANGTRDTHRPVRGFQTRDRGLCARHATRPGRVSAYIGCSGSFHVSHRTCYISSWHGLYIPELI